MKTDAHQGGARAVRVRRSNGTIALAQLIPMDRRYCSRKQEHHGYRLVRIAGVGVIRRTHKSNIYHGGSALEPTAKTQPTTTAAVVKQTKLPPSKPKRPFPVLQDIRPWWPAGESYNAGDFVRWGKLVNYQDKEYQPVYRAKTFIEKSASGEAQTPPSSSNLWQRTEYMSSLSQTRSRGQTSRRQRT
jgi:hypothetical protein